MKTLPSTVNLKVKDRHKSTSQLPDQKDLDNCQLPNNQESCPLSHPQPEHSEQSCQRDQNLSQTPLHGSKGFPLDTPRNEDDTELHKSIEDGQLFLNMNKPLGRVERLSCGACRQYFQDEWRKTDGNRVFRLQRIRWRLHRHFRLPVSYAREIKRVVPNERKCRYPKCSPAHNGYNFKLNGDDYFTLYESLPKRKRTPLEEASLVALASIIVNVFCIAALVYLLRAAS